MKFCKKCGSLMIPKKEGSKTHMACTQCSYKEKDNVEIELKEKVSPKEKINIIEEEKENIMPLVSQECPKCDHKKAFFWSVQTRAADEPETKFFKCEKCKHIWRDYS